ncbi:MAG TPA: response regulator [Longimicrobiales bacterium]|nr:response regulator [Longimicrobiales bacterium]
MKPAKKKVLLLDDEPIVCDLLRPALEKIGFYVESYTEGQKVVDRVMKESFDVLVTDLKMQKPDGLEVMDFVHRHSPGTKVVIITGFATVETARETLKGGAVDFIAKPFKIRTLCDLIVKLTSEEAEAGAPG